MSTTTREGADMERPIDWESDVIYDSGLDKEEQARLFPGPRVTEDDVMENIVSEHFFTALDGVMGARAPYETGDKSSLSLLIFCVLVLKNGFTVTGESACVSSENFDEERGSTIAYEKALDKVWLLMGYELKQRLHEGR